MLVFPVDNGVRIRSTKKGVLQISLIDFIQAVCPPYTRSSANNILYKIKSEKKVDKRWFKGYHRFESKQRATPVVSLGILKKLLDSILQFVPCVDTKEKVRVFFDARADDVTSKQSAVDTRGALALPTGTRVDEKENPVVQSLFLLAENVRDSRLTDTQKKNFQQTIIEQLQTVHGLVFFCFCFFFAFFCLIFCFFFLIFFIFVKKIDRLKAGEQNSSNQTLGWIYAVHSKSVNGDTCVILALEM